MGKDKRGRVIMQNLAEVGRGLSETLREDGPGVLLSFPSKSKKVLAGRVNSDRKEGTEKVYGSGHSSGWRNEG